MQPLRDLAKQLVAVAQAECVVYFVETVDVDEEHRAVDGTALLRVSEDASEPNSIRETGEFVVGCDVIEFGEMVPDSPRCSCQHRYQDHEQQ